MAKKKIKVPKVVDGVPMGEVEIEVDDNGATWGPNDKHRLLNKHLTRVDGAVKATGVAMYTQDVRLPGMLIGRFLTSRHAHAKLTKFDSAAAEQIKGVKAVMPVVEVGDEVRFEGQPVAAVAATTPEAALDAVRAIVVEYEKLPHVVSAADATQPGAPAVLPPRNPPAAQQKQGDPQKTAAALATCDFVI